MKRVLIALSVGDDWSTRELAWSIKPGTDATVWEWPDFWRDVKDGVLGPSHDSTQQPDHNPPTTTPTEETA